MVAVTPEAAAPADQEPDLRWKVGAGLAVIWVLTQLWIASPWPYSLARVTGIDLIVSDARSRGLFLGFALCLAFVLFQARIVRLPWIGDAVLATAAGVVGSVVFWRHEAATALPGSQSVTFIWLALLGLALLIVASGRVFGWLAAILVTALAFLEPLLGVVGLVRLPSLDRFLAVHWYSTESVLGIPFGLLVSFGFQFVVLGTALDVLGAGRPIARYALACLPQHPQLRQIAFKHPFVRRVWALTFLIFTLPAAQGIDPKAIYTLHYAADLGFFLFQAFIIYLVSLGIAWACSRMNSPRWQAGGLGIAVGGMMLGTAEALKLGMVVLQQAVVPLLGFFVGPLRLYGNPLLWLIVLGVLTVALAIKARREVDPLRQGRILVGLIVLPLVLFFWEMSVERLSPALSAFFAVVLMLIVMIELSLIETHRMRRPPSEAVKKFASAYFVPLCYGTARVMVRAAILVAAYGMLFPIAWFFSTMIQAI